MKKIVSLLIWVVCIAAPLPVAALTVTTATDELNVPAGASISLREAIRDTAVNGTVDFDASLSGDTFTLTMGELIVSKNLTIDASSLSKGIIIDGDHTSRVMKITFNSVVTLKNITFTQGSSTTDGGALHISGSSNLTLTDCTLIGNEATLFGGAIYCNSSALTLNGTRVINNASTTSNGGGIYMLTATTVTINTSTISNNSGFNGGGIYGISVTSLTIRHSTVNDNEAHGSTGGGIYMNNTPLTMENSTVAGNHAASSAGGIYYTQTTTLALDSCTISTNTASVSSGGILLNSTGTRTIKNTIVAVNSAPTGPDINVASGVLTPSGVNLIGDNNGCSTAFPTGSPNANGDYTGTTASPIDPQLSSLGYYGGPTKTMHPLAGSPAIEAGGATTLLTDQREFTRVVGAAVDIGAVEAGPALVVNTNTDENDGALGVGSNSLRECIEAATTPGTRIVFAAGMNGTTTNLQHGQIDIVGKTFIIDASAMANRITVNAANLSRIFHITADSTIAIHHVNHINGTVTGSGIQFGAGIYLADSALTLMDSNLSDCHANSTTSTSGGAIYSLSSTLVLHRSDFVNNSANSGSSSNFGGGIGLVFASTAEISDCVFNNNLCHSGGAANGGAIATGNFGTILYLQRCTFINNQVSSSGTSTGGAIHLGGTATTWIDSCSFSNNSVSTTSLTGTAKGGGINCGQGELFSTNCTLSNNTAGDSGGGIAMFLMEASLIHCTYASNTATGADGGALYVDDTTLSLENNIVATNTAGGNGADIGKSGNTTIVTSGANLIGDNDTVATEFPAGALSGTTGSPVDPLLGTLDNHGGITDTLALTLGSPALDSAQTTDESPDTDQRGFPRIFGSLPDLGAYEAGHIAGGYPAWAAEKIPSLLPAGFADDSELDTNTNGIEYATSRIPTTTEPADILSMTRVAKGGGGYEMHITFPYEPNAPDIVYVIQRNTNLGAFGKRYRYTPSTGIEQLHPSGNVTATRDPTNKTITIVDDGLGIGPRYFWRLNIELSP